MAISSGVIWEVRANGNINNSAGFNPQRGGTDYSQQAVAQVVFTDLIIDSVDSNKVTSPSYSFGTPDPGNTLRINGGGGFTVDVYEIVAASGNAAILDRSCGTVGSSGGLANLGGAVLLSPRAFLNPVAGNTVYVSGGTHSVTGVLQTGNNGVMDRRIRCEGYGTVRGDGGRPTLVVSTSGLAQVFLVATNHWSVLNFTIEGSGNALVGVETNVRFPLIDNILVRQTQQKGFYVQGSDQNGQAVLRRCAAVGVSGGVSRAAFHVDVQDSTCILHQCVALSGYTNGFFITNCSPTLVYCISSSMHSVGASGGNGILSSGIRAPWIFHATLHANDGDGIQFADPDIAGRCLVQACLIESNLGYGIHNKRGNLVGPLANTAFRNNAFFNNTLGVRSGVPSGTNEVILTASALISVGSNNFGLNSASGGGALCKMGAVPNTYPGLPNTLALTDIGAVQT